MANNYKSAQKHREFVTLTLTEIKFDIEHIKEKLDGTEKRLSMYGDRIGKTENAISLVKGVGSSIAVLFSVCFGYFFNKN